MLQWLVIFLSLLSMLEPVKLQETDVNQNLKNMNILLGSLVTKSNTQMRELQFLRNVLTSFSDLMAGLNDSFVGLNDSMRSLHEQVTDSEEQSSTCVTNTQQANLKLSTLISDLSQHQQQTAAESAQFQILFAQLHQILTNNLTHLLESVKHYLESDTNLPIHTCGGTGGWKRVVYFDMTDPSTTCPSGWQETGYSRRTCGRTNTGSSTCDSVSFPVNGGGYSKMCGRIKAYQVGTPDAFQSASSVDSHYVDGVSVTHGNPRRHIWTFAAGPSENNPVCPACACPCDMNDATPAPVFVGDDYFCESGKNERWDTNSYFVFFSSDPLWDGQNCLSSSRCCSLHNPPYFVKELPSSTTDNIEVRICLDQVSTDEDIAVEMIELYVQ